MRMPGPPARPSALELARALADHGSHLPLESTIIMTHHHLEASVQNCHWGYFDARRAPVLRVASGDTVTIDTVTGAPDYVPKSGFYVPPAQGVGSCLHLASVLQEGRKSANVHARSAVIRGIPVQCIT